MNTPDIKVSVIIPVYNAEKYLRQCLDSVLDQTLRDIEVICVDDGSTDSSLAIIREYAAKDPRLRLLTQPNSGAGAARNLGIENANGKYIAFVDADDWVELNSLAPLYETASKLKVDVLRCRAYDYDNKTEVRTTSLHNALKRVPFFLFNKPLHYTTVYWLLPKVTVVPWGGIFRKAFLTKNNIRFSNLICVNDRSFFWESVLKAERIAFSRTFFVNYRTNISTSLVGNRIKNFECHFRSYEMIHELTRNLPMKMRRCILSGELLDIANWVEACAGSKYSTEVYQNTKLFLDNMDVSPWKGKIEKQKWWRRMIKARMSFGLKQEI